MINSTWCPPDMTLRIKSKQFNLCFITVWESFRCFFANLPWGEASICLSDIKPRSVESCSDGCPSGRFHNFHTGSPELGRSPSGFLVATLAEALLPLQFSVVGGHRSVGNLQRSRISIYLFFLFLFCSPSPWHLPPHHLCWQFPSSTLLWGECETLYRHRCVPSHTIMIIIIIID